MKPAPFMRLKKVADESAILKKYAPKDLVIQEKIDGWKLFASKQKGKVTLYTRRGINVTKSLPSVAEKIDKLLPNNTAVLGELTYLIKGKQSITAAQSIISAKPEKAIERTKSQGGKIVYYVYDILERRGKRVTKEPFKKRDKWVRSVIPSRGLVQSLKNYRWSQRESAFKNALKAGGEGIVVKPWDSKYILGRKSGSEPTGESFKLKRGLKAQLAAVILKSYTKGKERLIFPAYQLKDGKYFEVGKLSGLPRSVERQVAKKIDAGKKIVVEVSFQERMPSGKLRHMGWKRLRPDKPVKSTIMNALKKNRQKNPRRSKVKDALAAEAIRHSNFDEFAKKYWLDCARGIYWYATNNENFHITDREVDVAKAGRFQVACNPEFALMGAANENKKYVAELNVNKLSGDDFKVIRGADGAKIKIVSNLDKATVSRVLEREKALRSWKYQQSLLPSSKEQLKGFWKDALKKEKEREAKEAAQKEKERRREERRKEKARKTLERKLKKKGRKNPSTTGLELPPIYGGPMLIKTDIGEYSYVGNDGFFDLYQVGKQIIGINDGAALEPDFDWRKAGSERFYALNRITKFEAVGPTIESVLDQAHRGRLNPKKNPTPYLVAALMNPQDHNPSVTPGVREVPSHVNIPKY